MNGMVIMVCGRLCCGKTTYCNRLISERGGVLLSCDEITLQLFDGELGDRHDDMVGRIKRYLLKKAAEITRNGADVLLDWGFWRRSDREAVQGYFATHGIATELHYLEVPDVLWKQRIEERNDAVRQGRASAYLVDEGLLKKFEGMFEPPLAHEVDIFVKPHG